MMRLLPNRPAEVRVTLTGQDGDLIVPAGAVTWTMYDAAGVQVATGAAVNEGSSVYRADLTAAQMATLGEYRLVFAFTYNGQPDQVQTRLEIVGSHLFTIAEARTFDDGALASTSEFPADVITSGREFVEEYLEHLCGVSFVTRRRRVVMDGSDRTYVRLPDVEIQRVVTATLAGDAIAGGDLLLHADLGRLYLSPGYWPWGEQNVVVTYEHGYVEPPEPIKRAGLLLLRDRLLRSNIDDRSVSFSDDLGTRQLAVPGRYGPTGIPEVDRIIEDYSETAAVLH